MKLFNQRIPKSINFRMQHDNNHSNTCNARSNVCVIYSSNIIYMVTISLCRAIYCIFYYTTTN